VVKTPRSDPEKEISGWGENASVSGAGSYGW